MEKKYHSIKYCYGIEEEDEVKLPVFKTKRFTKNHVKRYGNHTHKLAKLDKCSYLLINYLADYCNESSNEVFNTIKERKKFIEFCSKNCSINYKDCTVKKSFLKLLDVGLLLKFGPRISYIVNPVYFFGGTETNRRKILQQILYYYTQADAKVKNRLKKALGL